MPDDRILRTKLAAAEAHELAVDRGAALDWLDERLAADGTVVLSALPGSGRLDLLGRWSNSRTTQPTAWLRLDAADDVSRFLGHLLAALRTVDPRIGADLDDAFAGTMESLRAEVMPVLVADCARHGDSFNLVVHGVDRVVDPLTVRAMRAMQRNRPPNVRLIWSS